jgi:hypothetical protein
VFGNPDRLFHHLQPLRKGKAMKRILLVFFVFLLTAACSLPFLKNFSLNKPLSNPTPIPPIENPIESTGIPGSPDSQNAVDQPPLTAGEMDQVLKQIQQQVIDLRGLSPKVEELKQDMLTPSQLAENVKNDFFKDYTEEDAKADVRELAAFGLLPPGFDIYKLFIDLYSEQVAGYYDPETKDMFVIQGDKFTGTEKMTYAHEYTHVLQDQNWDMEDGLKMNDDYCENHTEYCAGVQSLVEGDASLTEQFWYFSNATEQDQQEVMDFYSSYTSPVFDSTPYYLQQDFVFPYDQGLNFVQTLFDGGGWAAVDRAYENPPSSTEMILHPEKYPSDTPVEVPLKDLTSTLGTGWEETTRNTMGEWYLKLILSAGDKESARLDEETAAAAAAGWAGDTYTVNWNESAQKLAVILRSRWESGKDTDEFWKALSEYGRIRWGSPTSQSAAEITWEGTADNFIKINRSGDEVFWIIAPDKATADEMTAAAK